MVIVARTDLKISAGKLAAQAAHAAVDAYQDALDKQYHDWIAGWREGGDITKIVLGVDSEGELCVLRLQVDDSRLPTAFIVDHGRTELIGRNPTCLAIGPAPVELIDALTGHLDLYRSK